METTNFVTKKSLTGTLANMSVKDAIETHLKDFKEYSIRNAAIKIGKIDSGRKTELHRQLPPLS